MMILLDENDPPEVARILRQQGLESRVVRPTVIRLVRIGR
jgi:predicted nuclease of predicted toxin-antitoxin system